MLASTNAGSSALRRPVELNLGDPEWLERDLNSPGELA